MPITEMDFVEDIDEYLNIKGGAQLGKIKKRKRTLSEGSVETEDVTKKVLCSLHNRDFEV